jgi:hypothetical protein
VDSTFAGKFDEANSADELRNGERLLRRCLGHHPDDPLRRERVGGEEVWDH